MREGQDAAPPPPPPSLPAPLRATHQAARAAGLGGEGAGAEKGSGKLPERTLGFKSLKNEKE